MSCSSSSSRKSMHGGGSLEFWREYIGGTSLQLFEVIHRAIELAKIDYPDKFLAERDGIAQNLFSTHLLNKKHSKEEEVDEDGVVVSCFTAKKATTAIEESPSLSKGRGGVDTVAVDHVDERSSHRPPTITISCQVQTTDHKGPTMRGIQQKQISPRSHSVLKPKPIHHLPPNHHQLPPTAPANPKLVEKKLEATKRKLREAYHDEEDRRKRIRTTQILDCSQSAKLLHQNNATTGAHQLTNKAGRRNNNNTNAWATRRRR